MGSRPWARRFGIARLWTRCTGVAFLAILLAFSSVARAAENNTPPLLVFAAASLKNALDALNEPWKKHSGHGALLSYAASSALARQVEAGAAADVFLSADIDWVQYLADKGLVRGTWKPLLGNELVLIAPKDSTTEITIDQGFPLSAVLGNGYLAMGNVESVPAGKYGKAALETLGVWESVSNHIAQAESVRAALALVARKEAPLGIVYATDAKIEPAVRVVGTFPENTHPPIVYPVAVLKTSTNPEAENYVAFLNSAEAAVVFRSFGFTLPTE